MLSTTNNGLSDIAHSSDADVENSEGKTDIRSRTSDAQSKIPLQHDFSSFPSLPTPSSPVDEQLPTLKEKAIAGDNDSSLELFSLLYECGNIINSPDSVSDATLNDLPEDIRLPLLRHTSQLLDLCEGISQEDMEGTYHWLDLAAQRGHPHARYLFASLGLDVIGGAAEAARNEHALIEYKARSREYLNGLARQCYVDAIGRLSFQHAGHGILYEKDMFLSYVYRYFADMLHGRPHHESHLDAVAVEFGHRTQAAVEYARHLYETHCQIN